MMNKDINNKFNQMKYFNDQLLDSSIQNYETVKTSTTSSNGSDRKKPSSGCPFSIETRNDPLKTRFDFHYPIGVIIHPYDYLFDTLNYNNVQIKSSKQILSTMPKHLRNTLFIRNDKIKQIRQMEFTTIFIIAEEMKEKINDLFNREKYEEALNQYNLVYSLFKWIEFSNKAKEAKLFNCQNAFDISSNPIVDSDIIIKGCRVERNIQYEDETFKAGMAFLLKAMGYCYIHLQVHTEAVKCMNEALEYFNNDSKPDCYFRRGQARMYNKFSTREEVSLALADFKNAIQRKKGEKIIEDHYFILKELIKTKEEMEMNIIKKLLSNFAYAHSIIKKKKLDINQTYQKNYDMNHLNYKIMKEMEESYYLSLRHYQKTNNKTEYKKGLKEFEEFLDGFIHYKQFYDFTISKIPKWQYDLLTQKEKEDLSLIASSPQLHGLFSDFKYKKCDEIYMNMQFNQNLWNKCFNIVNEKEKLDSEPINRSSNPLSNAKTLLINCINTIAGLVHIKNSFLFYLGSIALLLFSIAIIVPQIYIYSK